MTRQRRYQLRQRAFGLCECCGQAFAVAGASLCLPHLRRNRERVRARAGSGAWAPGKGCPVPMEHRTP